MEASLPDSPTGNYTLPPSYKVANGDTADASQHNPPFEDLAQAVSDRLHRDGRTSWTGNQNANGFKVTGLTPATGPGEAVVLSQVMDYGVPIGSVLDYAGATPPDGWLLCNGQAVSRTSFQDLFAKIGTAHGIGNGTTTFNVPDLRGRVVAGLDNMGGTDAARLSAIVEATTLGASGGVKEHVLTVAQMPSHKHNVSLSQSGSHNHDFELGQVNGTSGSRTGWGMQNYARYNTLTDLIASDGQHTHTVSETNQGGGTAHPNVQPTMVLNKIIKAR